MAHDCPSYGKERTFRLILFENQIQTTSASPCRIYMLLTSSVLSATSKQCFEQPAASFLVCSLIFIEYKLSIRKS